MGFSEIDQRGAERIRVVAPCEIGLGGRTYSAELADISLSGCRVTVHQFDPDSVSLGEIGSVSFLLLNNSLLTLQGKLVRTQGAENGAIGNQATFQFCNLDTQQQARLERIFNAWMAAWSVY